MRDHPARPALHRALLLPVFLSAVFALAPIFAAPRQKAVEPNAFPIEPPSKATRVYDFQGDDLSLVLRAMAHDGRVTVAVDESVTGTVNMRFEDKSPREVIEILAEAKDLIVDKDKRGVLHIRSRNPPPAGAAKADAPETSMEAAMAQLGGTLAPAILKFGDSLLDYQARPETAQKIAKGKKALYDALIAEGFRKEEAFQLILASRDFALPNLNK
jgi:hypothetical protein